MSITHYGAVNEHKERMETLHTRSIRCESWHMDAIPEEMKPPDAVMG